MENQILDESVNFKPCTVWEGDNLQIMKNMNSNCVDLVYLDPPFCSMRNYEASAGSQAEGASFNDAWTVEDINVEEQGELADRSPTAYSVIESANLTYGISMKSYLIFMSIRLLEVHRILNQTGSVYLHCDPTASHYLKLVMDGIFGKNNFRNEIVWFYIDTPGRPKNDFPRKHDIILRYVKNQNEWIFNGTEVKVPIKEESKARYNYSRTLGGKSKIGGDVSGKLPEDVWQIPTVKGNEKTGYPTQKPIALLERIIKASSNEGSLIFDPFCGCATTLVAANKLKRNWIGIDKSPEAIQIIVDRFKKVDPLFVEVNVQTEHPVRTDILSFPENLSIKRSLFGRQNGNCKNCNMSYPFDFFEVEKLNSDISNEAEEGENFQLLCRHCARNNIEPEQITQVEVS